MSSQSHLCSSSILLFALWTWTSGSRHGSALPSDWAPRERAECMSQAQGAARKPSLEQQSPHHVPHNEMRLFIAGLRGLLPRRVCVAGSLGPKWCRSRPPEWVDVMIAAAAPHRGIRLVDGCYQVIRRRCGTEMRSGPGPRPRHKRPQWPPRA
ncbi:hypothetical protein GQ607_002337 [Colletotrichum asianum]|uniref:Secreted protein n=1 Tax=Colletotrichum asianum TaxID=702518 RepID=A0A8H3ZSQ1_9PEZI|nr:hypothetical protein GQ607_002337 [Colletotrichum asianum]